MSFAVISDIHGNLEALDAVLEDIKKHKLDEIYCLGDIVGYGPNPQECIERCREHNIVSIMGNHDETVGTGYQRFAVNERAEEALDWTGRMLEPHHKEYLKSLDYSVAFDKFVLSHGDLTEPRDFNYVQEWEEGKANLELLENGQILLIGHLHRPFFFYWSPQEGIKSKNFEENQEEYRFRKKTIINVGSVGQPRDRNPDACWVQVWKNKVRMHRVPYDIETTQKKLRNSGMKYHVADQLAKRLELGK